jgi:sugar lactone lactonase YvrE
MHVIIWPRRQGMLFAFCSVALLVIIFQSASPQEDPATIPVNRSYIAFTIPEKDLLPENVAYDPIEEAFYVGSTRKGKIVKVDKQGKMRDFVAPRQDGLWMVIGMKVDAKRRLLWVNSSAGDNLIGYRQSDTSPAGVFKFDLRTGKLIKKYLLDNPGETHFFNDLTLDEQGAVFVTHMFKESAVYRIAPDADRLEVFARTGGFTEPNGITLSANGQRLFVAHDEGISAFEVSKGTRHQLAHSSEVSLKGVDGLYFTARA